MKLSDFKSALSTMENLTFTLPDGKEVPSHFHITEVGQVSKHFIDCGGTERLEKVVNFQLWEAQDYDHRLAPEKLQKIIALSEKVLGLEEGEIEVEYQTDTISKYGVAFRDGKFYLTSKFTDCLASDACGIPDEKRKVNLAGQTAASSCCTPGGGCC